jgi:hypothetical protein
MIPRSIRAFVFLVSAVVLAIAAGCGTAPTPTTRSVAETTTEDLAALKEIERQVLARIERLAVAPQPAAILVIPSRSHWESMLAVHGVVQTHEYSDVLAVIDATHDLLQHVIERRNLFATLRTIRADASDATAAPPGGYVIWLELIWQEGSGVDEVLHIAAAGQKQMSEVAVSTFSKDRAQSALDFLRWIETYTKSHRPMG